MYQDLILTRLDWFVIKAIVDFPIRVKENSKTTEVKLRLLRRLPTLLYSLRSRPLEVMGARKNWALAGADYLVLEGDINRYI